MQTVILYPHRDFAGTPFRITSNARSLPEGIFKAASSLRIIGDRDGPTVHFFNGAEYEGPELVVPPAVALPRLSLLDRMKSVFFCMDVGHWNDEIASVRFNYARMNGCATRVVRRDEVPSVVESSRIASELSASRRRKFEKASVKWKAAVHYMSDREMRAALTEAERELE
jgi:hypothetical protein